MAFRGAKPSAIADWEWENKLPQQFCVCVLVCVCVCVREHLSCTGTFLVYKAQTAFCPADFHFSNYVFLFSSTWHVFTHSERRDSLALLYPGSRLKDFILSCFTPQQNSKYLTKHLVSKLFLLQFDLLFTICQLTGRTLLIFLETWSFDLKRKKNLSSALHNNCSNIK